MAKRHLTKAEILAQVKRTQISKKASEVAPFTGMLVLLNYTLWKDKGWKQAKLVEFNEIIQDYITNPSPEEWLHNRLKENGVDDVHCVSIPLTDMKRTGNKFLDSMARKSIEYENAINTNCMIILLNGMNVLLDMGLKPYKIQQIANAVDKRLMSLATENISVMDWHRELIDGVGIYVDMPSKERRKDYIPDDVEVEIL